MTNKEILISDMTGAHFLFGSSGIVVFIISLIAVIYITERILYKSTNTLLFSNEGIIFYSPENGKTKIKKSEILHIYISNENQLKIIMKENISRNIRSKYWNFLKILAGQMSAKNEYIINLNFINCDVKEVEKILVELGFRAKSKEVMDIINNAISKLDNPEQLLTDVGKAELDECIIKIYQLGEYTQKEISSILGVSISYVQKAITKCL